MTTLPASLAKVAEVTRAYANFSLPLLDSRKPDECGPATLVEQAEGLSVLRVAVDSEPAETTWRSTLPFLDTAARRYAEGRTVNQIADELGIHWNSAAKLLERAGVRQRRKRA